MNARQPARSELDGGEHLQDGLVPEFPVRRDEPGLGVPRQHHAAGEVDHRAEGDARAGWGSGVNPQKETPGRLPVLLKIPREA